MAAAEYLNFTKAADFLSLTQPAVSHHISQLEEEFGVPLFIRGKNGLSLTPEARLWCSTPREWPPSTTVFRRSSLTRRSSRVKLCVGLTHTAESNLTTEVLAKCSSEKSGFTIMIVTDTINNLYTMLENYELDLAIVEGNASHPSMNSLVLNTDFLVCVMSADNPLSRNALVTLEELKKGADDSAPAHLCHAGAV